MKGNPVTLKEAVTTTSKEVAALKPEVYAQLYSEHEATTTFKEVATLKR